MPDPDSRIIVKIDTDQFQIPYEDGAHRALPPLAAMQWQQLALLFPGASLSLNRILSLSFDDLNAMLIQARSRSGQEPPPLPQFMAIDAAGPVDAQALVAAAAALPFVKLAYQEPRHTLATVNPDRNPLSLLQGYFAPAPTGIDAFAAWTHPGADGSNVRFMDIEWGWKLDHEDLIGASIIELNQSIPGNEAHSTTCLGIVLAQDNTRGIVGAAPNAQGAIASELAQTPTGTVRRLPDALSLAAGFLEAGDVLLLELQTDDGKPVEVSPYIGLLLRTLMLLGIVVIEPAGNGAQNLDLLTLPDGSSLDRFAPNFFDSGVIMVGARRAAENKRAASSCFGSRVDCHAWGESIVTTSVMPSHLGPYSGLPGGEVAFGGTSGASAIIAGAAVLLQSLA